MNWTELERNGSISNSLVFQNEDTQLDNSFFELQIVSEHEWLPIKHIEYIVLEFHRKNLHGKLSDNITIPFYFHRKFRLLTIITKPTTLYILVLDEWRIPTYFILCILQSLPGFSWESRRSVWSSVGSYTKQIFKTNCL